MKKLFIQICKLFGLELIDQNRFSSPTLKISLRYATLFSFIMLLPNSDIVLPSISDSLFPILLLGIGSSGIAFVSFYNLINDVGAVAGSITVYIIPIFSTIFGFVFLTGYEITSIGVLHFILPTFCPASFTSSYTGFVKLFLACSDVTKILSTSL